MSDHSATATALVIDDQDDFLRKFERIFGPPNDDQNLLPPSPGKRLKYFNRPGSAIAFLEKIENGVLHWSPDYAFIDFQFTHHAETGLGVTRALAKASPSTTIVIYVDLDATRTLFAAAMRAWYDVVHVVDKTQANDAAFDALLAGTSPTPPMVEARLAKNAHLVNGLFKDPSWARIWANWKATQGNKDQLVRQTKLARTHIEGFLGAGDTRPGAPEAVLAYQDAFELKVVGQRDARRKRQMPITDFEARHARFFGDPMLEKIVQEVEPWNRLRK